jgi:hypothetical protein
LLRFGVIKMKLVLLSLVLCGAALAQNGGGWVVPGSIKVPPSQPCLGSDANGKIIGASCSGTGLGVSSFKTRTGAVVPATNDYGFNQLSGQIDPTLQLPDSGVTAGTYGDSTHVAAVTVDAKGRVTAASSVAISGGAGSGTVNSGTSGQFATYPSTGTAVSGHTLVSGDIPTLNQSTTGNAATATALAATPTLCSTGNAPTGILANGNATGCAPISGATYIAGDTGTISIDATTHKVDTTASVARTDSSSTFTSLPTFNVGVAFDETNAGTSNCATSSVHDCIYFDPTSHAPKYTDNAGAAHAFTGSGTTKTWIQGSLSTGQTFADGTFADFAWDTNNTDNTGPGITHSTSVNPERFTAATAGYYHGTCQFFSTTGVSGVFFVLKALKNVGGVDTTVGIAQVSSLVQATLQTSFSVHLAVGDYMHCGAQQNSGASMTTDTQSTGFVIEN